MPEVIPVNYWQWYRYADEYIRYGFPQSFKSMLEVIEDNPEEFYAMWDWISSRGNSEFICHNPPIGG